MREVERDLELATPAASHPSPVASTLASRWQPFDTAPFGRVVMTKIDDARGSRNEGALKRSGNLWFVPDGSMYVYYRPTHWRELTDAERDAERAKVQLNFKADIDAFNRACAALAKATQPADPTEAGSEA